MSEGIEAHEMLEKLEEIEHASHEDRAAGTRTEYFPQLWHLRCTLGTQSEHTEFRRLS